MDATKEQTVKRQLPVTTLLVIVIAVFIAVIPGVSQQFAYDRAAILGGQSWRLFTGNWVHLSTSHLICDLLAVAIAGWIVESRGSSRFGWLCVVAACTVGIAQFCFFPGMQYGGGLSGVAVAAAVFASLSGWRDASPWRWICRAMLLAIAAKIAFEWAGGGIMFASAEGESLPIRPSLAAHLAGALTAVGFHLARSSPADVKDTTGNPRQAQSPGLADS